MSTHTGEPAREAPEITAEAKSPDPPSNLRIWDALSRTDPRFTKKVALGSRKFTAIDAYAEFYKATAFFGPLGVGWGWSSTLREVWHGDDLVAIVEASVWYLDPDTKARCTIGPVWNCTPFIKGGKLDDDAPKKALTGAIGKCLSYLGMSADVYLGAFDGNKYVEPTPEGPREARPAEPAKQREQQQAQQPAQQRPPAQQQRAPQQQVAQRPTGTSGIPRGLPAPPQGKQWTAVPPDARRKADLSAVSSKGNPVWFSEPVTTPKGKAEQWLWGHLTEGSDGGERRNYLEFLACTYDYARKPDGSAKPPQYAAADAVHVARAQACLIWLEEVANMNAPADTGPQQPPDDSGDSERVLDDEFFDHVLQSQGRERGPDDPF